MPVEWSPTRNIAWKTAIPGRGHSSPIVWNDRVFLTTAIEGEVVPGAQAVKHMDQGKEFLHPDSVAADRHHTFNVLALDANSGKVLWEQTSYAGIVYDARHRQGSVAAPTPVTDGKRVYAFFGPEGVYAYELDGRLAWKTSVGKIATLGLGVGTSPILYGSLLILQCDDDDGQKSFIAALDTGSERKCGGRRGPCR